MIRATLETRHFTFEAYGNTEAGALEVLRRGWNHSHLKNYPDAQPFDDFIEEGDVCFYHVEIGSSYCDGEEMKPMPTEQPRPLPIKKLQELHGMAENARPLNEDEWGSERQINAQNAFFEYLERVLTREQFGQLEDDNDKATSDEMINNGLRILGLMADTGEPKMSHVIDGKVMHRVALKQAYEAGERAKAAGKPASANPYATEVHEWDEDTGTFKMDGPSYCPGEDQRDAWNEGYGL